jgi:hypothetical protein
MMCLENFAVEEYILCSIVPSMLDQKPPMSSCSTFV